MSMTRFFAAAAIAATGALGAGEVEARDVDVQWSVTIGSPIYAPPVYLPPPPVYVPRPVYVAPVPVYAPRGYHAPRHWDRDGDGIPNRYDRRYNPRWDRDGDGVPNRYDRYPNGRHGWHSRYDGHGWNDRRGGHDGRGGHDRRGPGQRERRH
jgi:hypothetical protein